MGIAGAGIGAHSGLFGGGAGGVSDLSYLSEAGPEFGAGGTNWLGSGVDASWGVNQVPLDSFGNQMTSGEPWAMEEGLGSVGANTYTAGGQLLPAGTSGGGTSSIPDWLKSAFPNATWGSLLTGGAKGILDYLAADKMSDVNQANFDRVWGAGAPSRERFEGSFAPGFMSPDLTAALPVAAETRARALSTGGNPADNPGMQAEIDRYLIGNYILPANESYRRTNLAGGSLGFSEAQNFAQNQTTLAGAPYNAIATGVGAALNPSPSLEDLLKRYNINLGRAPA